ncbi:hypothetical protein N752_29200 [Desulforamulus aquiferis]|nr:hypothetical protein [Desulforamulus aquiferis]RYD01657.1 hypothetical protein N752_29200 [Desulforamulus aquiferis]
MGSNTPKIGLYKINPETDGAHTFNVDTHLNDNWDKIDHEIGQIKVTDAAQSDAIAAHLADGVQDDAHGLQAILGDASPVSLTLPHGLSLVNAGRSSVLKPKFKGRQLVNLLGSDGNCEDVNKWSTYTGAAKELDANNKVYGSNSIKLTLNGYTATALYSTITQLVKPNSFYILLGDLKNGNAADGLRIRFNYGSNYVHGNNVTDTSKFSLSYVKFGTGGSVGELHAEVSCAGASGQYCYMDGIRVYEITQAEYNELGTLTSEEIAERYPYVDSFQCVQNPAVRVEGVNLLPPFSQWDVHANAKVVEPYKLELNASSAWQSTNLTVKVVTNTKYTILCSHPSNCGLYVKNVASGAEIAVTIGTGKATFTTPANCNAIYIEASNTTTGTFTFSNPMLVLGDTLSTEFKPYNTSFLYLQTPLYEGETLEEIDGKWLRTKKWEKVVLDGSLDFVNTVIYTNYKRVSIPVSFLPNATDGVNNNPNSFLIKYNGNLVSNFIQPWGDQEEHIITTNHLHIIILNSDSGWGENYTPTVDEIKAFFLGWRMYNGDLYTASTSLGTTYSGAGTKKWAWVGKPDGSVNTLLQR